MKALRTSARSGHEAKVRKLSGSHGTVKDPTGNMPATDEYQVGPQTAGSITSNGERPQRRLDKPARASGGRVNKKPGVNINIISGGKPDVPAPPMMPPPAPPPAMLAPKPPMAPPPGAGGPPMGGPPMGGMPMGRRSGGRVHSKRDVTGKFTGGAITGVGRLEKARKN